MFMVDARQQHGAMEERSMISDEDDDVDDEEGVYGGRLLEIIEQGMPRPNQTRSMTTAEASNRREVIDHTWDNIRRWLRNHQDPDERASAASERGNGDATPLHNVCKLSHPPTDIVQALLEAAPSTIEWTDTHGWLPLHHACANGATGEVLRLLTDAYPEGKTKQDSQNRTPLHFYLTQRPDNASAMAQNLTLLSDSGAAQLPDGGGMLPMHYACAYGVNPQVLEELAAAYPESILARENKGRSPMHLAMVNAHRDASPGVIRFLLEHGGPKIASELVNMRDHDDFLPLHLLVLGLKGLKADEPDQRNNVSECLKMYLRAEPIASADFLTAIQDLPDWLQDVAVVSPHVRDILNRKIVQRFPTFILMLDGIMLLVIIVCFEIATRDHINDNLADDVPDQDNDDDDDEEDGGRYVPLVFLFIGGTYFLMRELIQIISMMSLGSFSSWFYDATNWLDMAVITLVYYYAVVMIIDRGQSPMFRSGVAFTKGVLWSSVIYFLKSTLVDFAVFVGGVFYVLQRLLAFLMAVCVILLAFAQMFHIVYTETAICKPENDPTLSPTMSPTSATDTSSPLGDDEGGCDFPHCTFPMSLLKVYTMMMGEIGDETRYETSNVAQLLYIAYSFLVVILLSNVLIAIVTDSYEIIQNDRAAIVFWSNRLDFIAEMDAISYGCRSKLRFLGGGRHGNDPSQPHGPPSRQPSISSSDYRTEKDYFYEGWKSVVQLFDSNLYDDIDLSPQNIEFWCFFLFRFGVVIVIPFWIIGGVLTFGLLWPPQIREFIFVQKETAISRSDLEKHKLEQLREIQNSIKVLKNHVKSEMASDREEMMRMKTEVDSIQTEVLSDLQQVKELMTTLLDMGRERSAR